jgi:hypothetical protein
LINMACPDDIFLVLLSGMTLLILIINTLELYNLFDEYYKVQEIIDDHTFDHCYGP